MVSSFEKFFAAGERQSTLESTPEQQQQREAQTTRLPISFCLEPYFAPQSLARASELVL